MTDPTGVLEWEGRPVTTLGDLLSAAGQAQIKGKASEFLAAYRDSTEHADANLGYAIGYVEPPERRAELYAAFELTHPIFGGQP